MLNPRIGTSIRLIPGLRLYVSWGASGFHFNMGGNPATIARGIRKKLADSSSRKAVDAEAEMLDAMLDEERYEHDGDPGVDARRDHEDPCLEASEGRDAEQRGLDGEGADARLGAKK
jgi:hypothetical protein